MTGSSWVDVAASRESNSRPHLAESHPTVPIRAISVPNPTLERSGGVALGGIWPRVGIRDQFGTDDREGQYSGTSQAPEEEGSAVALLSVNAEP